MPNAIDLTQVGAFPTLQPDGSVSVGFGLYLPGITAAEGDRVVVRVIHDSDRRSISGRDRSNFAPVAGTHFGSNSNDFSQQFAQDYVATVNAYLLNEFHVDGFRYDEVTDLYVSPTDTAYAKLVYDTYNASLAIPRFQGAAGGYSRIIQVAEALYKARTVLALSLIHI